LLCFTDEWWEGLDRESEEYKKKKEEAADFLWSAIEEYIPDARNRAEPGTVQIGTPLTVSNYLLSRQQLSLKPFVLTLNSYEPLLA
jgi:hypothetical protein